MSIFVAVSNAMIKQKTIYDREVYDAAHLQGAVSLTHDLVDQC